MHISPCRGGVSRIVCFCSRNGKCLIFWKNINPQCVLCQIHVTHCTHFLAKLAGVTPTLICLSSQWLELGCRTNLSLLFLVFSPQVDISRADLIGEIRKRTSEAQPFPSVQPQPQPHHLIASNTDTEEPFTEFLVLSSIEHVGHHAALKTHPYMERAVLMCTLAQSRQPKAVKLTCV